MRQFRKILIRMTTVMAVIAVTATAFATQKETGARIFGDDYEPTPAKARRGVAVPDSDKLVTSPPPRPGIPGNPPAASPNAPPTATGEDSHFIQGDDYFIQQHSMDGKAWIWVELAKMATMPNAATKGEAEFMKVKDGRNYWTSHFWSTRQATSSDLKLGMTVICFNNNFSDGVYNAPHKKENARGGSWFMARITDMSDSYKGYLTVSGNYRVSLHNLRIPVVR